MAALYVQDSVRIQVIAVCVALATAVTTDIKVRVALSSMVRPSQIVSYVTDRPTTWYRCSCLWPATAHGAYAGRWLCSTRTCVGPWGTS